MRFCFSLALCLLLPLAHFSPVRQALAGENNQPQISIRSVQADFTQEKHLQILARPLISRGRFLFKAPDSLRWEYTSPFHSVLLMNEGRVRKFIRKNGQLIEEKGMQLNAMQVVMTEISGWLDGQFSDNAIFHVKRDGSTVALTPKKKGMATIISAIELRLADRAGLLQSVTIFEDPQKKSFTRMIFNHALVNQPIAAHLFTAP